MVRCCVDIELYDIDTEELFEELLSRKLSERQIDKLFQTMSLENVISALKMCGVPNDLIEPIKKWERIPTADEYALDRWLKCCGALA